MLKKRIVTLLLAAESNALVLTKVHTYSVFELGKPMMYCAGNGPCVMSVPMQKPRHIQLLLT